MTLSVVIVSWQTKEVTRQCLKSLFIGLEKDRLETQSEVIVIENNSQDGSGLMIKKEYPRVILVENKENVGFGRANNQALAKAKGDFVFFLNSDTLIPVGSIRKLVEYGRSHPRVGVVGPKLLNSDGTDQPSAGSFPDLLTVFLMLFGEHFLPLRRVRSAYSSIRPVDWVMGAAMMCRREVLVQSGGFDPKIFMYMEEVELCYRIKKAGWIIHYLPDAVITHLGGASSPRGRQGQIQHIYRGLDYFYARHYSSGQRRCLRAMLKVKSGLAFGLGKLIGNGYLRETYGKEGNGLA